MTSSTDENKLAQQHYVTLILHLLVDPDGQLIHGELVDAANTFRRRFVGGTGLITTVENWLTRQEPERGSGHEG